MHNRVTRGATAVTALAAATATVLGWAVPAWAHIEVSADKPRAGATNVTVTFNGEAESDTAGIKSERVVLPAGITPDQVRLGKAPSGWTFTRAADGFTVGGKALKVGQDARFSVVIAQLPADATELAFKTVETYGDGKVSRWIEIPQSGQPEPDNPAPVLKLKAAAQPAATTAAPTTAATTAPPTTGAPATSTEPAFTAAPAAAEDSGSRTGLWVAVAAVVVVAAAAGVAFALRRRAG